jgi:hypothetical protein
MHFAAATRSTTRLLDLKPWQDNPLNVDDEVPSWMHNHAAQLAERKRAIAIRRQLLDRVED